MFLCGFEQFAMEPISDSVIVPPVHPFSLTAHQDTVQKTRFQDVASVSVCLAAARQRFLELDKGFRDQFKL